MSRIASFIPWKRPKNVVRIIRLEGIIHSSPSSSRALNLRRVEKAIDAAFETKKVKPKAVCLEVNSMGGSAMQSNLIFTRIREQAKETEIPVLSFAEDAAVSGGYWLALAGDEIYVDPNSVIGSIGAVWAGLGMVDAIKKLGIERRLVTAGENKIKLDPLQPLKSADKEWIKGILDGVHSNFIEVVKERRPKLDTNHKTVFTGDVFLGKEAVAIGIADGVATDLKTVCQKRFGKDVVFQRCEIQKGFFAKLMERGMRTETSIQIDDALDAISIKEMSARYGL